MTLCRTIEDREYSKFVENTDGDHAVRTVGESITVGLNNDAIITEVAVTDAAWVKINTLLLGQGINIQNPSDSSSRIKVNHVSPSQPFVSLPAGWVGMEVTPGQERFYTVQTGTGIIDVYVKAESGGSVTLNIEQLG